MTYNKIFSLFFFLSFFINISFSQEPIRCGTDEILEHQLQDEKFARSYFKLQRQIENLQNTRAKSSNTQVTIPVIVHVIHQGEPYGEENHFTIEYIQETIDNVNDNFLGEFSDDPTANTQIDFCIANNSVNGDPIDGIRYYNWDDLYTYDPNTFPDDDDNSIDLSNLIGYDSQNYCNIYVLDWGGNPLGFAYLPSANFGVFMNSNFFGLTGGNYGQNRTLVHELGHYCGLYHTFHFTQNCDSETNCISQGDRVCDTPPTTGNFGCPTNGGVCGADSVNNFMDYTYDTCMDSFTEGQGNRMLSALEVSRPGIVNNTFACGAADGVEVSISGISVPVIGCNEVLEDVTVQLNNFGNNVTEIDLLYNINGITGQVPWSGSLDFGEDITINIPNVEVGFGDVSITVEALIDGDINEDNNTLTYEFENYEGVEIDIVIDFDVLPAGIDWDLYEAVNGEPFGEPIFEAGYEVIDFNNLYSCETLSYTFCLEEGEYVVVMTDVFGNGLNYPFCDSNGDSGDFTILNNSDTLNYVFGGWDDEIELPFVVELGCDPLGECPWDINDDGIVNVPDVLFLLENFTLESECNPADFNLNGVVDVDDLLDIISYFGYICSTGEFMMTLDETFMKNLLDQYGIIIEENPIESVEYYTIHGAKLNFNDITSSGIYIVKTKYVDGSYDVKKVIK